jgi:prepilin peptidase CpaA
MFVESTFREVGGAVFTLLLVGACVSDVQRRRIPNVLVLILALCGLGFSLVANPIRPGAAHAAGGAAVGLVIWLPFWMMGKLGAGDVKLFAAAGAWLGPMGAVTGALVAAVCGGILTLGWLVHEQGVASTLRGIALRGLLLRGNAARAGVQAPSLLVVPATRRVPYGLALAAGALLVAWLPALA